MPRKPRDTSGWPIMPKRCPSCPFNEDGDAETRSKVLERTGGGLNCSQICHHNFLHGKKDAFLCRGLREIQLELLHRLKLIDEPTDEAFASTTKSLGITPPKKAGQTQ